MDLNELAEHWIMVAEELRRQATYLNAVPEMKNLLIAKAMVYEQCAMEISQPEVGK
jgi:hypothetical protein